MGPHRLTSLRNPFNPAVMYTPGERNPRLPTQFSYSEKMTGQFALTGQFRSGRSDFSAATEGLLGHFTSRLSSESPRPGGRANRRPRRWGGDNPEGRGSRQAQQTEVG